MTQVWKDTRVVPVTLIKAEPNLVTLVRSKSKDGYEAAQVALGRHKREFKNAGAVKPGDSLTVGVFQEGDKVSISGIMKGRGFQGVVKRYNFGGGPKTHGQKNRLRAPGSIGSTAPQRVVPGRRMAGHMGDTRITVKNLVIAGVDAANNILMVRGAVPGAPGGLLEIRKVK